jgi:hypothetical protein
MARSVLVALLLWGATRLARPEPSYDLPREIAWARSTWPADLKGIRFHSPKQKLLDWVRPGGSITVWAFSPKHACAPLELSRPPNAKWLAAPALARLRALDEHAEAWQPRDLPLKETPSLHRTPEGCRRAHAASPKTTGPYDAPIRGADDRRTSAEVSATAR